MVRNVNLLRQLSRGDELDVEFMIQILTAGEEDGRKYVQTEEVGVMTDASLNVQPSSQLFTEKELEEINQKITLAEKEIDRLKRENRNLEAKSSKNEIEKYK